MCKNLSRYDGECTVSQLRQSLLGVNGGVVTTLKQLWPAKNIAKKCRATKSSNVRKNRKNSVMKMKAIVIILVMLSPGVNGFFSAETFNNPYLMNHNINMLRCEGDNDCQRYWKDNLLEHTKNQMKIIGSLFLWSPFMQKTQILRNGVESRITELLGTGKMSSFVAWVAGSSTQASIVKAASDITGPILKEERIVLKVFLEQFSEEGTKIFDFLGDHGKVLSTKIWKKYQNHEDIDWKFLVKEAVDYMTDYYLLPIFSEKCDQLVGKETLNGYIKHICVSLLSEAKDKVLFEYAPSLYKEFVKKRFTVKDANGNEYISNLGEKVEDFMERVVKTMGVPLSKIRILHDGERCFDFTKDMFDFDIMFEQIGGGPGKTYKGPQHQYEEDIESIESRLKNGKISYDEEVNLRRELHWKLRFHYNERYKKLRTDYGEKFFDDKIRELRGLGFQNHRGAMVHVVTKMDENSIRLGQIVRTKREMTKISKPSKRIRQNILDDSKEYQSAADEVDRFKVEMIRLSDKSTDITLDLVRHDGENPHKFERDITKHHEKNYRELNNISPNLCRQRSYEAYEDFTYIDSTKETEG